MTALGLTLLVAPVSGQNQHSGRIGLALSGGSAKGFAHIGVLKVLAEAGIPVDVVAGTSMGGIVGGLYAIGYRPDDLQRVAVEQDWSRLFAGATAGPLIDQSGKLVEPPALFTFPLDNGRLQLPASLASGQEVWRLLARLTWPALTIHDFRQFPIPFVAVATDIGSGQAVTLDHGSLPDVLRASMSLPGVFSPVTIDGRVLVDGGIARNLPSAEAKALGADRLICSDVSDPLIKASDLRSFVDVLMQTISFQMNTSTVEQRKSCDVLIEPDLKGLSSSDFSQALEWIHRGETAARAAIPQLRALVAGTEPTPAADLRVTMPATRTARRLVVRAEDLNAERFVRSAVSFPIPGPITADALDSAINRLVGSGAFQRVTYRLEGPSDDLALALDAVKGSSGALGFGFRYDSRYQAALLFDATFRNQLTFGSSSRVAIRLGEQLELTAQHVRGTRPQARLLFGVNGVYDRTPVDVFADDVKVAQVTLDVANLSAFASTRLGRSGFATLRVKGEHARGATDVSSVQAQAADTYYTVAATLSRSSFDRPAFPRRGASLFLSSEGASRTIGSGATFWEHIADLHAAIPIRRHLSLLVRTMMGAAGGPDLPFQYQFFLGGSVPSAIFSETQPIFPGLRGQERVGRAVQLIQIGAQYEFANQLMLTVRAHSGNTSDRWRLRFDDYATGYEVTLGALTAIGPVEIAASGRGDGGRPRLDIRVGRRF